MIFRRLRHPLPPYLSAPKWLWKGNQAALESRLMDILLVFKTSASGDTIHNKKDAGQRWRGNSDQRLEVCCHGDWQVKEIPFFPDPWCLPFRFCLIGLTFYTFMTTVVLLTSAPHMHVPWGQHLQLSLNVLYQYIMLSIAYRKYVHDYLLYFLLIQISYLIKIGLQFYTLLTNIR